MYDEEYDRPATPAEAYREWVWNAGQDRPDQAWLLTDFDTWEPNPYYSGPPEPHPEQYDSPPSEPLAWDDPAQLIGVDFHEAAMNPASVLPRPPVPDWEEDDIPF